MRREESRDEHCSVSYRNNQEPYFGGMLLKCGPQNSAKGLSVKAYTEELILHFHGFLNENPQCVFMLQLLSESGYRLCSSAGHQVH